MLLSLTFVHETKKHKSAFVINCVIADCISNFTSYATIGYKYLNNLIQCKCLTTFQCLPK